MHDHLRPPVSALPCAADGDCLNAPEHMEGHAPAGAAHRPRERRRLLWAMGLTGVMMVVEAVFGILTGSLALLSDAGHMLTHFLALTVSFFAIVLASRPTSRERSFGLYRAEVLAAVLNGFTMILVTGYIFYEAFLRFRNPVPIATGQMLFVAILGLLVNLATALILWRAGERNDLNLRSAFLHMLSDTMSSAGIVAAGAVIHFAGGAYIWLDPAVSVAIAFLILLWSWRLLRDSAHVLLESAPRHLTVDEVHDAFCADAEVQRLCGEIAGGAGPDIHDIHVWEITSGMYAMTAHIGLPNHETRKSAPLLARLRAVARERFGIAHAVFEIEEGSGR
jgi:cobalt-zinc-cadmium efflux system protein